MNRFTHASVAGLTLVASLLPAHGMAAPASQQSVWSSSTSLPTPVFAHAAASDGGTVYVVGGLVGGQASNQVLASTTDDTGTMAWQALAPLQNPRAGLGAAIDPVTGSLFAVGGQTGNTPTGAVEELAHPLDTGATWATRAPLPTPRAALAVVAISDGHAYAIGGQDASGTIVATVEAFDPATNTWQVRAPMPTPRQKIAAAVGSDGKIYVVGGQGAAPGFHALATVEVYDPSTDRWQSLPSLPSPRLDLAAVAAGPLVYAIGGATTSASSEVDVFDTRTGQWQPQASMPIARSGLAAAVLYREVGVPTILTIGGAAANASSFFLSALDTVEMYGPPPTQLPNQVAGDWVTKSSLGTPRAGLAVATDQKRDHLRHRWSRHHGHPDRRRRSI